MARFLVRPACDLRGSWLHPGMGTAPDGNLPRFDGSGSSPGGLRDADPFFDADPEGFFLAEMDARIATAISVVDLSKALTLLGLYSCHPGFRGQGIRLALWQHSPHHAGRRPIV